MHSSRQLLIGEIYSRHVLRQKFDITDANLNNGVFIPKGHDSVWLFITEEKSADATQYRDKLDVDTLNWDGQTSGRTDKYVIEHHERGLELLVFYRKSKHEFEDYSFRYEGAFRYTSHSGGDPTHFVLERVKAE